MLRWTSSFLNTKRAEAAGGGSEPFLELRRVELVELTGSEVTDLQRHLFLLVPGVFGCIQSTSREAMSAVSGWLDRHRLRQR